MLKLVCLLARASADAAVGCLPALCSWCEFHGGGGGYAKTLWGHLSFFLTRRSGKYLSNKISCFYFFIMIFFFSLKHKEGHLLLHISFCLINGEYDKQNSNRKSKFKNCSYFRQSINRKLSNFLSDICTCSAFIFKFLRLVFVIRILL